jgi:hypothetical protein
LFSTGLASSTSALPIDGMSNILVFCECRGTVKRGNKIGREVTKTDAGADTLRAPNQGKSMSFVIRACCANPAPFHGWVEHIDETDGTGKGFSGQPGAIIETLAEPPAIDRAVALHEAGHAVIAHALGRRISSVSVAPPARVIYEPGGSAVEPIQRIAESFAGFVGEMSDRRFYRPMGQADEDDYLARVHSLCHGQCDGCSMAMLAWHAVGFPAGHEAARAVMRQGQEYAIDYLMQHRPRLAVHRLADRLLADHRLDGETAHNIINELIEFGRLTAENKES